jgi:hypothetical protein
VAHSLGEEVFAAMPYCPNCLTEYVEGASTCADCGAQLAPGSPPLTESAGSPDSKLVTVRVFTGATALPEGKLAKNLLKCQGIPSLLSGEFSALLVPTLDVPLLVREEDAERAARILRDYLDSEAARPGE